MARFAKSCSKNCKKNIFYGKILQKLVFYVLYTIKRETLEIKLIQIYKKILKIMKNIAFASTMLNTYS